jgi:hydrogenase maturation protease
MMIMSTVMTIAKSMGLKRRQPRILIAGLGNYLLRDDGIGVHAVRTLQQTPPPGAVLAGIGTAVLDALHLLEWADKILAIDAVQAGGPPGTLYSFGVDAVEGPGMQTSLHELNFLAALEFLPHRHKPEILMVGMEPETIDYGLDLSPSVAAALPQLGREVCKIVSDWRHGLKAAVKKSSTRKSFVG